MKQDLQLFNDAFNDFSWFKENYTALKIEYEGEFVAIKDREVVAHAPTTEILMTKIRERKIDGSEVLIEYITPRNMIVIL